VTYALAERIDRPATSVPGVNGNGGCTWYFFCTIKRPEN